MSVINVVHANDPMAFDLFMYPEQSPMVGSYIANQLSSFSQSLTDFGRQFMETSREIYERVNDAVAIRSAKAALRMTKGIFHPNAIVPLETIEQLQAAQPMMQRFIMAEPTIRQLYHEQRIDGYSDTYVDVQPDAVGEEHYDYRRVMTGIIQEETNDDGEETWVARQYLDDIHPEDRELDHHERHLMINIWDMAKLFIQDKKDPTSLFGGEVG